MKEAKWYKKLKDKKVQCQLCPRFCLIKDKGFGMCNVRQNKDGKLYSLVYGKPIATAVDPIEKKPLYHFFPGSLAYSIGTVGCNLRCIFCQNWELSRGKPAFLPKSEMTPKQVVENAIAHGCKSIAYTYNDPIVFSEYVLDIAKIAKKKSIKNIFVTNGFINQEPLKELCKYLDAAAVDLKGFTEKFYKKSCDGKLKPVLEALKTMKKNNVWIEIINLIIPTLNDNMKDIGKMCLWIKEELGEETVLHFSRFFPYHEVDHLEPTPEKTLEKAKQTAEKAGLQYAYVGNIPGKQDTYCPKCKKLLIGRSFLRTENNIKDGSCRYCKKKIAGVFK